MPVPAKAPRLAAAQYSTACDRLGGQQLHAQLSLCDAGDYTAVQAAVCLQYPIAHAGPHAMTAGSVGHLAVDERF